jgi:hypothetical protein
MSGPSDEQPDRTEIRAKIMGLGERAGRKSYYPQLQARIQELEENKAHLQEKSIALSNMLEELERERRRAEESEKGFRVLFEHIADGILVVDMETGRFLMGNQSICWTNCQLFPWKTSIPLSISPGYSISTKDSPGVKRKPRSRSRSDAGTATSFWLRSGPHSWIWMEDLA